MATYHNNSNQDLILPSCPPPPTMSVTTDAELELVEDFLGPEKVGSLQQTVLGPNDPNQVGTAYTQLTDYQPTEGRRPVAEILSLHPALFSELRALQIEGGFETTSDLLHHLVISERDRRIQLQQNTPSRRTGNNEKDSFSSCQTMTCALDSSGSNMDPVNSHSTNHIQEMHSHTQVKHNCPCAIGMNRQPNSKTISVGLQVNLCQCKIKDEPLEGPMRKCKRGVSSKVKKKNSSLDQKDASRSYIQCTVVKGTVENLNGEMKMSSRKRTHLYPKHRMPKDTKSATRRKQEYLCEICGVTFKWRRSLIPHMWEHRKEVSVHRCPHCNTSFPYACRLKRHLIAKHPEVEGGPIRCSTCGVEVQSYNTLKSHMRIHTGYKPFKCKFCPKTYKWNTGLEYHERVHTGEKPFPCPLCSKAFTNKSDLTRHRTVHTGEKPYVCKKCGKAFTQSHTLKSHLRKRHPNISTSNDVSLSVSNNDTHPKLSLPAPNPLPPPFPSQQQAKFMLSSLQDHTSVSNCLEPFKFVSNAGLSGIQRQIHGLPTEREIAEVVVSMLTQ